MIEGFLGICAGKVVWINPGHGFNGGFCQLPQGPLRNVRACTLKHLGLIRVKSQGLCISFGVVLL